MDDNLLAIETRGLGKRFGSISAVDGLDLQVPSGKVYGFLGKNGAGKTTTIRMLLGLLKPDAGQVRLLGGDLAGNKAALLKDVGSLVESPSYYAHLTGRENLEITALMGSVPAAEIPAVLEFVGLAAAADMQVGKYSLGMKQRLGLALALLRKPSLLILDEPFNGLDPAGIREMRNLIINLPKSHQASVFLSSHLLSQVEAVADHVGVINAGKLVFQGPLDELLKQVKPSIRVLLDKLDEAIVFLEKHFFAVTRRGDELLIEVDSEEAARVNRLLVEAGFEVSQLVSEDRSETLETMFFGLTESGEVQ